MRLSYAACNAQLEDAVQPHPGVLRRGELRRRWPIPSTRRRPSGLLDVGDGNRIWWEEAGTPDGVPALILHGGPGSGFSVKARRFFDPSRYRIVGFDQRGCGRSTPHASAEGVDFAVNTTAHLIGDIEALRVHLGVERWVIYGASWGTTLGLAYAEAYPERVAAMVFAGVTTTRRSEIDWLYRGLAPLFPEEWARFRAGWGLTSAVRAEYAACAQGEGLDFSVNMTCAPDRRYRSLAGSSRGGALGDLWRVVGNDAGAGLRRGASGACAGDGVRRGDDDAAQRDRLAVSGAGAAVSRRVGTLWRVPEGTPEDGMIAAYNDLLFDPDPAVREKAAWDFDAWDNASVSVTPVTREVPKGEIKRVLARARIVTHFFRHAAWLDEGALLKVASRLSRVPGVLVQGRLDLQGPLVTAWELARAWPDAELEVDRGCGHSSSDAGMEAAIVAALDRFAQR